MEQSQISIASRAPCLGALYAYDYYLRSLLPEHVVVADTPFFVYKDGSLCSDSVEDVRIVSWRASEGCESLRKELRTLSTGIIHEQYRPWQLAILDEWAQIISPKILKVVERFDEAIVTALRVHHRLN